MNQAVPVCTLVSFLLVAGLACIRTNATEVPSPSAPFFVTASDAAFRYEGRIDFRNAAAPVFIWQGSRARVDFDGEAVAVVFGEVTGQCFFNLEIDGVNSVVEAKKGRGPVVAVKPGHHVLSLFKRSEADAGTAVFSGLALSEGGTVSAPKTLAHKFSIQFFGDSITVGACNEDGPTDQWETRSTHNNALSYGALTAEALGAGYRNIAVSGMGIVVGYVPKQAGQIWDRLYPEINSPKAVEGDWVPDVVCVNYGENDDSFSRNQGQAFPSEFSEGYVALVRAMRAAYPKAEIVLLRGGMFGGARSEVLRHAWQRAVDTVEAEDAHVHHFVFEHWSQNHPRVSDDKAMADELVAWLKVQPFMKRFL